MVCFIVKRMCALCLTCRARLKKSPNEQTAHRTCSQYTHSHIRAGIASITRLSAERASHGHKTMLLNYLVLNSLSLSHIWCRCVRTTAMASKHMVLSSMCEISRTSSARPLPSYRNVQMNSSFVAIKRNASPKRNRRMNSLQNE